MTFSRRRFLILAGGAVSTLSLGGCIPATPIVVTATSDARAVSGDEPEGPPVIITVIYDNVPYDARLNTAWGFSALVEYGDQRILFDTGGSTSKLLGNMAILGIDPVTIGGIVLSHIHDDHTGGLEGLLATGITPPVYVPPSFPPDFTRRIEARTEMVEVTPGLAIAGGVYTTGEMPTPDYPVLVEQALIVRSRRGLVIVTGCAHPGVVAMVQRAQELLEDEPLLVAGGFHLGDKCRSEITDILADLRALGVKYVAPSHCTGDQAIGMMADEYGDKFIRSGAGAILSI